MQNLEYADPMFCSLMYIVQQDSPGCALEFIPPVPGKLDAIVKSSYCVLLKLVRASSRENHASRHDVLLILLCCWS